MSAESKREGGRGAKAVIVAGGGAMGAIYLTGPNLSGTLPLLDSLPVIDRQVVLISTLSLIYLAAAGTVISRRCGTGGVTLFIVLAGLLFRASLVLSPPHLSTDVYRYVWDGRVQEAGINPYLYPPSSPELSHLRDEAVYPRINRKDYPTVYPAGAQLLFRLFAAGGGDSVSAIKALMSLFDALTILLLLALIQLVGARSELVLLYAWNPLVVHEISQNGHLEGVTIFFIVLALLLHLAERRAWGVVALAVAASLKLYPALLLPALLNRGERIRGAALFSICFAAAYLPYLDAPERITGFLPRYFTWDYERFNLALRPLLAKLFPALSYGLLSGLMVLALGVAGLAVLLRHKPPGGVIGSGSLMMGLMLILMPVALHPWYVLPLVAFQPLLPSPAWILFSCAVPLSYLKYTSEAGMVPRWVLAVEYLPLFLLLSLEITRPLPPPWRERLTQRRLS